MATSVDNYKFNVAKIESVPGRGGGPFVTSSNSLTFKDAMNCLHILHHKL